MDDTPIYSTLGLMRYTRKKRAGFGTERVCLIQEHCQLAGESAKLMHRGVIQLLRGRRCIPIVFWW